MLFYSTLAIVARKFCIISEGIELYDADNMKSLLWHYYKLSSST